jgi:hypothetical protein
MAIVQLYFPWNMPRSFQLSRGDIALVDTFVGSWNQMWPVLFVSILIPFVSASPSSPINGIIGVASVLLIGGFAWLYSLCCYYWDSLCCISSTLLKRSNGLELSSHSHSHSRTSRGAADGYASLPRDEVDSGSTSDDVTTEGNKKDIEMASTPGKSTRDVDSCDDRTTLSASTDCLEIVIQPDINRTNVLNGDLSSTISAEPTASADLQRPMLPNPRLRIVCMWWPRALSLLSMTGLGMAAAGIACFVQQDKDSYWLLHSLWHLLVMGSTYPLLAGHRCLKEE